MVYVQKVTDLFIIACGQIQLVSLVPFQRRFSSSRVCKSVTQRGSADISMGIF